MTTDENMFTFYFVLLFPINWIQLPVVGKRDRCVGFHDQLALGRFRHDCLQDHLFLEHPLHTDNFVVVDFCAPWWQVLDKALSVMEPIWEISELLFNSHQREQITTILTFWKFEPKIKHARDALRAANISVMSVTRPTSQSLSPTPTKSVAPLNILAMLQTLLTRELHAARFWLKVLAPRNLGKEMFAE